MQRLYSKEPGHIYLRPQIPSGSLDPGRGLPYGEQSPVKTSGMSTCGTCVILKPAPPCWRRTAGNARTTGPGVPSGQAAARARLLPCGTPLAETGNAEAARCPVTGSQRCKRHAGGFDIGLKPVPFPVQFPGPGRSCPVPNPIIQPGG